MQSRTGSQRRAAQAAQLCGCCTSLDSETYLAIVAQLSKHVTCRPGQSYYSKGGLMNGNEYQQESARRYA